MIHVLHIHHQHCRTCGATETFSHVYDGDAIADRGGRKLVTCKTLAANDGLVIERIPAVQIPVCQACYANRPAVDPEAARRWQETLKRKYSAPTPPVGGAQSPRKPSTPARPATAKELA